MAQSSHVHDYSAETLMQPEPVVYSRALADIPNIVHGFTSASGGASSGDFESFNLSLRVGDDRASVLENQSRALASLGAAKHRLVTVKQVHGNAVVQVTQNAGRQIKADGLWTRDRKAAVAILTADCVPILLADRAGTTVCALHAGWRGTKLKIVKVAIAALAEVGVEPGELCAAIGPAIGFEAFEIGAEVATELRDALGASALIEDRTEGKARADLQGLNHALLLEAGLKEAQIDILNHCTQTEPGYFSYRRDNGRTGRQGAIIALT
jgi:YfiH family protein